MIGGGISIDIGLGFGMKKAILEVVTTLPLLTLLGDGSTFTGGGQTVEQYDGSLVTVDADVSAHSGMRLATTVAEGAVIHSDNLATPFTSVPSPWVDNGDGTYTIDGSQAGATTLNTGTVYAEGGRYLAAVEIIEVFAGTIRSIIGSSSPTEYFSTVGTHTTEDVSESPNRQYILADTDFHGTIRWVSSYGVIPTFLNTDPNGYLCHPVDSNGLSLTLDPRGDSTPYAIGDKVYSGRFALTCTADGTSDTSAPAITSTDLGSTVVDGGVTWSVDSWYQVTRGYLGEEARTNYFINNSTPVTQQVTLGTGDFTVSVIGSGTATSAAVTATGTGFGAASDGTDNTFNLSVGGTVSITIAGGPPDRVDVQNGTFSTSSILTAGSALTRPKTVASLPTANVLPVNNFGARVAVEPLAAGLTGWALNSYTDADNELGILVEPTAVTLRKRIGGVDYDAAVSYTHAADTQMEVDLYLTTSEMGCRVREIGGAWSLWTTTANGTDAVIADTYQIGSRNDLVHLNGHFRDVQIYKTSDPKSKLESI